MKKLFLLFLALFCIGMFVPKVVTPLVAEDTVTLVADSSEPETVCSEEGMQCDSSQDANANQEENNDSLLFLMFLIIASLFGFGLA